MFATTTIALFSPPLKHPNHSMDSPDMELDLDELAYPPSPTSSSLFLPSSSSPPHVTDSWLPSQSNAKSSVPNSSVHTSCSTQSAQLSGHQFCSARPQQTVNVHSGIASCHEHAASSASSTKLCPDLLPDRALCSTDDPSQICPGTQDGCACSQQAIHHQICPQTYQLRSKIETLETNSKIQQAKSYLQALALQHFFQRMSVSVDEHKKMLDAVFGMFAELQNTVASISSENTAASSRAEQDMEWIRPAQSSWKHALRERDALPNPFTNQSLPPFLDLYSLSRQSASSPSIFGTPTLLTKPDNACGHAGR
ncbi:unnamed protein product [Mycena citricolor]|uniref:Uncharacterized protein n=1 Tax=Mycena citricolor TaxID=2018698 RepID=A0AAD2K2F0_9AGAR|nr:unnamed protein product [Mycena citricolor]